MFRTLVSVLLISVFVSQGAEGFEAKPYKMVQVELSPSIRSEFSKLSRSCNNYGYNSYRPSYSSNYYRPTSNTGGFNLGSLIGPAVFGLAAGAGVATAGTALSGLLAGLGGGK